ncbi:membrane dipeptidase [bacterium]|nr:membrane dipeptidase [bacterium]
MEYCDLHCDTPLKNNPIINNDTLQGLKPYINFAFCFLHNETFEEKKSYFQKFMSTELLKNKELKHIFSLEGLRTFNNIDNVLYFIDNYNVKIVSLAWFEKNLWACGAIEEADGITEMGKDLIKILNEKNIIIDISHASEKTSRDIFNLAENVIATHSNIYSIEPHVRNLKDWQLKELKQRNSVFGLNMYNKFLGKKKDSLLKHIKYALDNDYGELISLGSDFDGMEDLYIHSPEKIPYLYDKIKNFFSEVTANSILNNKRAIKIFK